MGGGGKRGKEVFNKQSSFVMQMQLLRHFYNGTSTTDAAVIASVIKLPSGIAGF